MRSVHEGTVIWDLFFAFALLAMLGGMPVWFVMNAREETTVAKLRSEQCETVATRCDAELVTCISWQARVKLELEAIARDCQ